MPKNFFKSEEAKRSRHVHITVTEDEFQRLVKNASEKGMNNAQYCRHKIFYERKG